MSDELFNNNNLEQNNSQENNSDHEYSKAHNDGTTQNFTIIQDNVSHQELSGIQDSNTSQEDTTNQYRFTNQDIIQDGNITESETNMSSGSNTGYRFWAEDNSSSTQSAGDNVSTFDPVIEIASENNTKVKTKLFRKAAGFIVRAALFGVIAGASFLGFNYAYYQVNPNATPIYFNFSDGFQFDKNGISMSLGNDDIKIATTTVSNAVIQQKTDITDVVEKTMPSIVTITSTFTESFAWFGEEYNQQNEGGGSGIIVGENDTELLIATNNHVVAKANKIMVDFINDEQVEAIVKGTDATADLAVITIEKKNLSEDTLSAIKIAKLGDSESVKVGQMAVAIGNALGYGQSVTVGYVSAKDREVDVADNKMVLLQTDAAINPGNSGGALLNLKGEVIGINTVKYASSEVEGMGYAIPISRAVPIIDELMNREILKDDEKGYLGIYIEDITQEFADAYGWPIGVYVKSNIPGGSAEKAGIFSGDIITAVNGSEITTRAQLQERITSYRVGTEIKLTIMRSINGEFQEKEITVVLGQNPELDKQ